jgi:hypothetical protein
LFVVSVVFVRYRSLRRIDHSSTGVLPTVARRCVLSRNLENVEAKARYRAVKVQPQWVVTPEKKKYIYISLKLKLTVRPRISEICEEASLTLRGFTSLELVQERVICLQAPTLLCLDGGSISLSYWMNIS